MADPRRVSVVGSTGSGKTTFAAALASRLAVPHVELDALHHGPNWTEVPDELFRVRTAELLAGDGWVADGNYSAVRDIVWARAELVVWLDYPLPLIMYRLTWRTVRRLARREELWNGNRERLSTHLFTRDSLFWWAVTTYRRRRRSFAALRASPRWPHLRWLTFRSPGDADAWLAAVDQPSAVTDQRSALPPAPGGAGS
jgi:adenylate kinase family enzyme